jgi:hypothetical protein
MNNVIKYALISVGLNLLAGIVLFIPLTFAGGDGYGYLFFLMAIGPLSLIGQLVVGLVYAAGDKKKELGQGMLLAVGFFLLVGLSICGPMWMG